jgi:hypothetical protein
MNSVKVISDYISTQFDRLNDIYKWNFNLNHFPDKDYVQVGANPYQRSRHLREMIHNNILKKSPNSNEFQIWYVKNWGGVKTNKAETLHFYIDSQYEALLALHSKGIATWSKILSVRNPNQYAIYDARVAVSLNSIQKKFNVNESILFPQLISRNSSFVLPTQAAIKNSSFFKVDNVKNFYEIYLNILHDSVLKHDKYDIQDAEMVLFSNAEELSNVWK